MKKINDEHEFTQWNHWDLIFNESGLTYQNAGVVGKNDSGDAVYRVAAIGDIDVLEMSWVQMLEKKVAVCGKTTIWGYVQINKDGTSQLVEKKYGGKPIQLNNKHPLRKKYT